MTLSLVFVDTDLRSAVSEAASGCRGSAINGCCAAVRGAILGSQGVSFVLQVSRLPSAGGAFRGWQENTRPDVALLPPCPNPSC